MCTTYRVECINVLCIMYSVHCTMTLYKVHCTMYIVNFIMNWVSVTCFVGFLFAGISKLIKQK